MIGPVSPKIYSNEEIAQNGKYKCPLCAIQTTSDGEDIGWVHCPMVNNRPIGYGCCTDYQAVALLDDFETNSYRSLFVDAENITGKSIKELRITCLEHQENLAQELIVTTSQRFADPELVQHLVDNYERLIAAIKRVRESIGE